MVRKLIFSIICSCLNKMNMIGFYMSSRRGITMSYIFLYTIQGYILYYSYIT